MNSIAIPPTGGGQIGNLWVKDRQHRGWPLKPYRRAIAGLSAFACLLMLLPAQAIAQVDPNSFGPVAFYSSGNVNTVSVAVGDLDNDGFPDLVTVSQCYSNSPLDCHAGISVLINNSDGTFKPAV